MISLKYPILQLFNFVLEATDSVYHSCVRCNSGREVITRSLNTVIVCVKIDTE